MFPSFPIPQQKLGDCSSNKLYRQLCMHYEHSSRGIRGCTFEEEALYFEFSKTPELSKTADTIVRSFLLPPELNRATVSASALIPAAGALLTPLRPLLR